MYRVHFESLGVAPGLERLLCMAAEMTQRPGSVTYKKGFTYTPAQLEAAVARVELLPKILAAAERFDAMAQRDVR